MMELLDGIFLILKIAVAFVVAGFLLSIGVNFSDILFKRKNKMKYYVVSYAHSEGFGRQLFGCAHPIDENTIIDWEKDIACRGAKKCCIISISKIDGPVTPNIDWKGDKV